jgi:hypothetical protein
MLGGLNLFEPLLHVGPLWLVGLIVFALCLLAREGGRWLYRVVTKDREDDPNREEESHVTGAIFGLLAFIIAFTFSIALDRFDNRRGLVIDEANAIGTTYLRAGLFDEPYASQMRETLRQYAHTRIAPNGVLDADLRASVEQSRALRDRFWEETQAAVFPVRQTEQASYFLDTANEMLDIGAKRESAGRAHIPTRILDVTLLYLLVSSVMLGYLGKRKGARRWPSTMLLFLFVIVIGLVLDLDQPRTGTITVPQRAMEDQVASMESDAARARPPAMVAPVQP